MLTIQKNQKSNDQTNDQVDQSMLDVRAAVLLVLVMLAAHVVAATLSTGNAC